MKLKSLNPKTLQRYFRSFERQSFVQRGKERAQLLEDIKSNDKETIAKRLTPEQKEYVDTIYETYFEYLPTSLQQKFYLYCMNEELKVQAPEELLFDSLTAEAKDYDLIQNPVEDFYTISKDFSNLVAESTKDIDMSKLAQQSVQKPVEETAQVAEAEEPVKKKFKVEVVGFDAAKKLNIIKEVKSMLNVGLKEVS